MSDSMNGGVSPALFYNGGTRSYDDGTSGTSVGYSVGSDGYVTRCPGSGTTYRGTYNNGASSNDYSGSIFPYGSIGDTSEDRFNQSPYFGSATDDGKVDCGSEGKMIYWTLDGLQANREPHLGLQVNLTNNVPTGAEGYFCLRFNVSVQYAGDNFKTALSRLAKNSDKQCYRVERSQIHGTVTSSSTSATGKVLGGVAIHYRRGSTDCSSTTGSTSTANDGTYTFSSTIDQPYCVYAESSPTIKSTTYGSPSPANRSGTCSDPDCYNKDFVYTPTNQPLVVDKAVISINGGPQAADSDTKAVKPGDHIRYRVHVRNPYDHNAPSPTMEDVIPNNLNTGAGIANTTLGSYDPYGGKPGGWSSSWSGLCGTPMTWGGYSGDVFCDQLGAQVGIRSSAMPAYSMFTYEWESTVKDASNVGVYPHHASEAGNSYAQHPNCDGYYANSAGLVNDCHALAAANFQDVYNIAWAAYSNVYGWSGTTANPIPGNVTCIGKTSTAKDPSPGGAGHTTNGCGQTVPSFYVYAPGVSEYDNSSFDTQVQFDTGGGPVYYSVIDQTGSGPLDPAIKDPSSYSPDAGHTYGGRVVQWNGSWTGGASTSDYIFQAGFNDRGAGYTGHNTSQVCWVHYWEPNHASSCPSSNTINLHQVKVDNPYVTTKNGDVVAGAGNGACPGINSNNDSTSGRLNGNSTSNALGDFFVAATGTIDGFGSRNGAKAQSYAPICRPDVIGSARIYRTNNPADTYSSCGSTLSSCSTAAGVSTLNSNNNKLYHVVPGPGFQTVSGTTSNRWTLFVLGDVYINSNITSGGSNSPFGLVATGDIYIDPSVQQLDGYYFAGNKIFTCSAHDGRVLGPNPGDLPPATCKNALKVNGVMMAKSFRLNRTILGTASDNFGNAAEAVQALGQFYTLTPPAFENLRSSQSSIFLGEPPPRY